MKYLIIPGLPLLTIALALHDENSIPARITQLTASGILAFGAAFCLLYTLYCLFSHLFSEN